MPDKSAVTLVNVAQGTSLTPFPLAKTTAAAQDIAPAVANRKYLVRVFLVSQAGTEVVTLTITATINAATVTIFQQSLDDQVGATLVLPGYIECDVNTAIQATLSGTSTSPGVLITLYCDVVGG